MKQTITTEQILNCIFPEVYYKSWPKPIGKPQDLSSEDHIIGHFEFNAANNNEAINLKTGKEIKHSLLSLGMKESDSDSIIENLAKAVEKMIKKSTPMISLRTAEGFLLYSSGKDSDAPFGYAAHANSTVYTEQFVADLKATMKEALDLSYKPLQDTLIEAPPNATII